MLLVINIYFLFRLFMSLCAAPLFDALTGRDIAHYDIIACKTYTYVLFPKIDKPV